ncbi:hypothetical protein DL769_005161 [Monosporascus sp. CRB-8-3]|nr:hypothetical protein DL769_005161 [Monosporascus sp. CRB-8-3]
MRIDFVGGWPWKSSPGGPIPDLLFLRLNRQDSPNIPYAASPPKSLLDLQDMVSEIELGRFQGGSGGTKAVTLAFPSSPRADRPLTRKTTFENLKPLTPGTIAPARPDAYYGAHPEQLDRPNRDELSGYIIPSTMGDKPMLPNFFLEAKGPDGTASVAQRHARYDGAIGARAMQSLRNYGEEEPVYDGNTYTFSSIYHAGTGTLQLYAHHVTSSTTPGGRLEYHVTELKAYALTGNEAQQHEDSASDKFVDYEDYGGSQAVDTENYAASRDTNAKPALHQAEEHSSESTDTVEPSMSFATSFTSSFSTQSRICSKRNGTSHSPPSDPQLYKKHNSVGRGA